MSRFDWDDLRFFLAVARVGRLTGRRPADWGADPRHGCRVGSRRWKMRSRQTLFERRPQGYALTEHGERLLSKGRGDRDAGACRLQRDRRCGSRPVGHGAYRRARRLRRHVPRPAHGQSGRAISGISNLQIVAMPPPALTIQARGRYRDFAGASERGQDRGAPP